MYKCSSCEETEESKFHPSRKTRCKRCLAAIQREYRKKRTVGYWKHKDKKYTLKKRYGLTIEEFEKKIIEQDNKCAICKCDPADMRVGEKHRLLHIDHNHKTGKVRGLLCNGCNRALGFLNDDIEKAKNLVEYLSKY